MPPACHTYDSVAHHGAAADNCQAPVLQQQLREMQAKEEAAGKAAMRSLAAQEREQKILVSLMYDLGMEMHR